QYTLTVSGLASGDALTNAHIHVGDPATSGGIVLNFLPTFNNGTATGTVTGVRQSLVDSLLNSNNELYVNVHSSQVPTGLVRAQVNRTVEGAWDIPLSGTNEVPAVTTTATGLATLRLTTDKKLYAKITVNGLEAGDALTAAHIHPGATGTNGTVLIGIYSTAADFGTVKSISLTDAQYNALKNDPVYVNAHSNNHQPGLIRGQIR
ncbi:MAG: CHRD domain-containing protein, partial [Chitinophagaceae bacterium]